MILTTLLWSTIRFRFLYHRQSFTKLVRARILLYVKCTILIFIMLTFPSLSVFTEYITPLLSTTRS